MSARPMTSVSFATAMAQFSADVGAPQAQILHSVRADFTCSSECECTKVPAGRTQAAIPSNRGRSFRPALQEHRRRGCRRAALLSWQCAPLLSWPLAPKKKKPCTSTSRSRPSRPTPANTSNFPKDFPANTGVSANSQGRAAQVFTAWPVAYTDAPLPGGAA